MQLRSILVLLIAAVALLAANLGALLGLLPSARAASEVRVQEVIRARLIELVAEDGKVVGQLHTAEDGSANLRLRSGRGEVRVKLSANAEGGGLVLLDGHTEPAVSLSVHSDATAVTLAARGKPPRVLTP